MKIIIFLFFVVLAFVKAEIASNDGYKVLEIKPVKTSDLPLFKQRHPKLYTVMQLLNKLHSRLHKRNGALSQKLAQEKINYQKLVAAQKKAQVELKKRKEEAAKIKKLLKETQGQNTKAKADLIKTNKLIQSSLKQLFDYQNKLKHAKGKFEGIKYHLTTEKGIVDKELQTVATLKKVVVTGAKNANKKKKNLKRK